MPALPTPETVAARLKKFCSLPAPTAVVLGSGFGGALPRLVIEAELSFSEIPGFSPPTVAGHQGRLLWAKVGDQPLLVLAGRTHYYEGNPLATVTFPVRVLAAVGVTTLLLTNAAGAINPRYRTGDFMCLRDHINFMGDNPLRGAVETGRSRFVDLTRAYDPGLSRLLRQEARRLKIRMHHGVYLAVAGPHFETPAEIRAFARLGADAVGMSTVPEVIVARQLGLAVAAFSCITNAAAGLGKTVLNHDDVLASARRTQESAGRLIQSFVQQAGL